LIAAISGAPPTVAQMKRRNSGSGRRENQAWSLAQGRRGKKRLSILARLFSRSEQRRGSEGQGGIGDPSEAPDPLQSVRLPAVELCAVMCAERLKKVNTSAISTRGESLGFAEVRFSDERGNLAVLFRFDSGGYRGKTEVLSTNSSHAERSMRKDAVVMRGQKKKTMCRRGPQHTLP